MGTQELAKLPIVPVVLAIYRRQKDKVGLSSANNIARLGEAISRDTFPKLIDEVKLDPKIQGDLIEAIKHAVQGKIAENKALRYIGTNRYPCI